METPSALPPAVANPDRTLLTCMLWALVILATVFWLPWSAMVATVGSILAWSPKSIFFFAGSVILGGICFAVRTSEHKTARDSLVVTSCLVAILTCLATGLATSFGAPDQPIQDMLSDQPRGSVLQTFANTSDQELALLYTQSASPMSVSAVVYSSLGTKAAELDAHEQGALLALAVSTMGTDVNLGGVLYPGCRAAETAYRQASAAARQRYQLVVQGQAVTSAATRCSFTNFNRVQLRRVIATAGPILERETMKNLRQSP